MWVLDGGLTNNTPIFPDRPRRALVFRLSDIFYPLQLLVSPKGTRLSTHPQLFLIANFARR
jgi:hypothetical protein